jgi:hypothetical protein
VLYLKLKARVGLELIAVIETHVGELAAHVKGHTSA